MDATKAVRNQLAVFFEVFWDIRSLPAGQDSSSSEHGGRGGMLKPTCLAFNHSMMPMISMMLTLHYCVTAYSMHPGAGMGRHCTTREQHQADLALFCILGTRRLLTR